MITTLLGTCDVCSKPNAELARCIVTGIETYACDECRSHEGLRAAPEDTSARHMLDGLTHTLAIVFVGLSGATVLILAAVLERGS